MARLIDLDDIVSLDQVVVLIAGTRYRLPGDVSVPDYFAFDRLSKQLVGVDEADDDPLELLQELHDRLLRLFQVHQPDLDELPVGPKSLLPLVFAYLNPTIGDEEEDAVPPTRRPASTPTKSSGGRRSTTQTPKSRRTASAS